MRPVLSFPCLRTINGATVNVLDRCLRSHFSLSAMHGSRFGEYLRQTTDCWAYSPVRRLREFSLFTQPPIDSAGQGVGAARDWLRITVLVCFPLPSMTDDDDDARCRWGPCEKDVRFKGEGGQPKSRHSKRGCVDFILQCGQGMGGSLKAQKFCRYPLWMVPNVVGGPFFAPPLQFL